MDKRIRGVTVGTMYLDDGTFLSISDDEIEVLKEIDDFVRECRNAILKRAAHTKNTQLRMTYNECLKAALLEFSKNSVVEKYLNGVEK